MTAARSIIEPGALKTTRVRIPQAVVYRSFAHETVVLNLDTGLYHGLNPTGGRMLDTLASAGSLDEAAATLAREYEIPFGEIQSDLCAFCEALVERGLLVVEPI